MKIESLKKYMKRTKVTTHALMQKIKKENNYNVGATTINTLVKTNGYVILRQNKIFKFQKNEQDEQFCRLCNKNYKLDDMQLNEHVFVISHLKACKVCHKRDLANKERKQNGTTRKYKIKRKLSLADKINISDSPLRVENQFTKIVKVACRQVDKHDVNLHKRLKRKKFVAETTKRIKRKLERTSKGLDLSKLTDKDITQLNNQYLTL